LVWHTGPVIAHRRHRITVGVAHCEVRAARATSPRSGAGWHTRTPPPRWAYPSPTPAPGSP